MAVGTGILKTDIGHRAKFTILEVQNISFPKARQSSKKVLKSKVVNEQHRIIFTVNSEVSLIFPCKSHYSCTYLLFKLKRGLNKQNKVKHLLLVLVKVVIVVVVVVVVVASSTYYLSSTLKLFEQGIIVNTFPFYKIQTRIQYTH